MADRIAVMNAGNLEAYDTPDDLYDHPKTLFIAGFVGNPPMNLIPVEVSVEDDAVVLHNDSFSVSVSGERAAKAAAYAGKRLVMGIRPEGIHITDEDGLSGTVFVVEPLGREDMIDVRLGKHSFVILASTAERIRAGDTLRFTLDMQKLQFFDPSSERSILWSEAATSPVAP